jgi:hypothetical protein
MRPSATPPPGAHVEQLDPLEIANRDPPPAIADPPPAPVREGARAGRAWRIEEAAATDVAYASAETVPARRYVYRVQLRLPETLAVVRAHLAAPAAELFVDVSTERLRARFAGPGWPVDAGSEVRIRGDSPGAYLFDREGGRSIPPGALATWFEGGPRDRHRPQLVVRRDPLQRPNVPGALICALLAEWVGEPRQNVMHRCGVGAPVGFRVGFWRGERTADVPVELPRRALRADHEDPPPPVTRTPSRAFLDPGALSRVLPMERPLRDRPPADSDGPVEGLEFFNQSEARVIVTAEGVALGWVDAGASGLFVGLRPGPYRVGALRPLGAVVIRPRVVVVPGRTVLRPPRRPRAQN